MSRILSTRRRKMLFTAFCCGVVGIAALAWAQWLTDSTGRGAGKAASLVQFTVNPGTPQGSVCSPGADCSGYFRIDNPAGNGPLTIIRAEVGNPADGITSRSVDCPHTQFGVRTQTGLTIPLPTGESQVTLPNLFTLAETAPTECQGVDFEKSVKITARTPLGP